MESNYKQSEDMRTILRFLDTECHYKEREMDHVAEAKELLERTGWIFIVKELDDDYSKYEIKFYNKYQYEGSDISDYANKYTCVDLNNRVWTTVICYAIEHFKRQMKFRRDNVLRDKTNQLIKSLEYNIRSYKSINGVHGISGGTNTDY